MRVFLSWSGPTSRQVAEALKDWLPMVLQGVKPFMSPDIEKGTRGLDTISKELEDTSFGIICLAHDNLNSEWIHYEAGALSKLRGSARVWTFLFNIKVSDVTGSTPLAQFQHTRFEKNDTRKLLDSINKSLPSPLEESVLNRIFEHLWNALENLLSEIKIGESDLAKVETKQKESEDGSRALEEILSILRDQQFEIQGLRSAIDRVRYQSPRLPFASEISEEPDKAIDEMLKNRTFYVRNYSFYESNMSLMVENGEIRREIKEDERVVLLTAGNIFITSFLGRNTEGKLLFEVITYEKSK